MKTIGDILAEDEALEKYVRGLRNSLYGTGPDYGTESGWKAVRANWMKPENVKWLEEQVAKAKRLWPWPVSERGEGTV